MPTPESRILKPSEIRPMVLTDIPGFSLENARLLIEKTPELRRVLLTQKEPGENQLAFILAKSTISLDLKDDLDDIGAALKKEHPNISWCYIPKSHEESFKFRRQNSGAEIICLFSREPGLASSK